MAKQESIPGYVEGVVNQWQSIAYGAYESFTRHGRVIMTIGPDETDPERIAVGVIKPEVDGLETEIAEMLEGYDPETELLIQFTAAKGKLRTLRLGTPADSQTPREIWAEHMLQVVAQDPESVDWKAMPAWFVAAVAQSGASGGE